MIILDTNVLSEPLRAEPNQAVLTWLDAQIVETLFLTTISLAEIRYGIAALPSGKRKDTLRTGFEDEILPHFVDRILPFDEGSTVTYAELRATARSNGTPIGDFDALIAAVARHHRYTVASRDTALFTAAAVPVINPFNGD